MTLSFPSFFHPSSILPCFTPFYINNSTAPSFPLQLLLLSLPLFPTPPSILLQLSPSTTPPSFPPSLNTPTISLPLNSSVPPSLALYSYNLSPSLTPPSLPSSVYTPTTFFPLYLSPSILLSLPPLRPPPSLSLRRRNNGHGTVVL